LGKKLLQLWKFRCVAFLSHAKMKKTFLIARSCLLLSACNIDVPPIESCFVGGLSSNGVVDKKELMPSQLDALSAWFSNLGGEWKSIITDSYPSGLALSLKHKNGRTTPVRLMRHNELWIGQRMRILSHAEREALMEIIAEKNLLPTFGK
jgi:hypothetical protein